MNKKGSYELADLAGFILIFIAIIIFGFIFIMTSPKSSIELIKDDYHSYELKQELLYFLSYEIDGKNMADWIVLGVRDENLSFVKKKSKGIFVEKERIGIDYNLYIAKDEKSLFDEYYKFSVSPLFIRESMTCIVLENLYEGRIYVRLSAKKYGPTGVINVVNE